MQNTHKGYILPVVMIVILLGLSGYVLFAVPAVEKQVAVGETPVQPAATPVVRADEPDDLATTTRDEDEPVATSTATTTLDISAELE